MCEAKFTCLAKPTFWVQVTNTPWNNLVCGRHLAFEVVAIHKQHAKAGYGKSAQTVTVKRQNASGGWY